MYLRYLHRQVTRYRQHRDQDEQSDQKTKKERALGMPRCPRREVYLGMVELRGTSDYTTILAANQLMGALFKYDHSAEAMELLEKTIPQAERALGPDASVTLDLRWNYGYLSFSELRPPWDERTRKKEAQIKADLADLLQRKRRVLGSAHPNVLHCQQALARLPTAEALWSMPGRHR